MADTRYGRPEWSPPRSAPGRPGFGPGQQPGFGAERPSGQPRSGVPRHGTGGWRSGDARRPSQQPSARRPRRADANRWNWLLLVPIVVPLMPGLYNRMEPTLFGVPFFYWSQLGFAFLASAVIAVVHLKVR